MIQYLYIIILHSTFNKLYSQWESHNFSKCYSLMKLFIINVGCFFFNCLVYFLMKEVYLRFFPEDGEFFCVLRFLWKPTFDWISIWHSRHALISIAIWKYIKESYLNKKCFFLIIEVFLDSMYMPYTHGAKRLQAMDDMK